MPDAVEEHTPPKRWLGKWVREEKFWQDVTTRTLAALIVIFFGYLYAVIAGYVGKPNASRAVAALLATSALAVLAGAYVRMVVKLWRADRRMGPIGPFVILVTLPVGLAIIGLLALAAASLLQQFFG
ncbi:hypothetical protein A5630_10875 [Mycolicibacterium mucogenicum]|uniref:Uncharacterized protein n=1 Tax=Mycolicibacterium mucogenicum TaxID=56689 RepID=A0A1A3HGP6_MYCMU|nr:hypothetical protein [Mycolicibacterium mucogenicum]OBJ46839.1 hypothetical protein A5630_10875 [Mycolicibacterium mucogenicum]